MNRIEFERRRKSMALGIISGALTNQARDGPKDEKDLKERAHFI